MTWTQGIHGLNQRKKDARRKRAVEEVGFRDGEEEEEEQGINVGGPLYILPNEIPSTEEVVI